MGNKKGKALKKNKKEMPVKEVCYRSNRDTLESIEQARARQYAGTLDVSSLDAFTASLAAIL